MNVETITQETATAVIEPEGNLISISLPALRARMRDLVGSGVRQFTVDLNRVRMVDSAGLGLLISAHNSLKTVGGQLAIVHASQDTLLLFKTMRIHQYFSVSGN